MIKFSAYHQQILNDLQNKNINKYDTLVVTGAGLCRTGTLSLQTALTHLLGAKCFHFMTDLLAGDQEDIDVTLRAMHGDMTSQNWRDYLLGKEYAAAVDFPMVGMFYKEIMKAFPDVKVILTTRDSSTWYNSTRKLWDLFNMLNAYPRTVRFLAWLLDGRHHIDTVLDINTMWGVVPEGCDITIKQAVESGPEATEKLFLDWEAEVKRSFPADRLLVFRADQGWAPLCAFLGVEDVPDVPYPCLHEAEMLQDVCRKITIVHHVIKYGTPLVVGVVACWMYTLC